MTVIFLHFYKLLKIKISDQKSHLVTHNPNHNSPFLNQEALEFTAGPLTGIGGIRIVRNSLFNCAMRESCFSYIFTA